MANTTASLSFEWMKVDQLTIKSGICVKFQYMMSRGNNTLILLVQTFSGTSKQIWFLRGDHGDKWHHAAISLSPVEDLKVNFIERINGFPCSYLTNKYSDACTRTRTCTSARTRTRTRTYSF